MITQKNLPFFNVVADGVASISLPLGMTYNRIVLALGGTSFTKAMITRIVCKLNGKPFYDITGTNLDKINKWRGIYDAAGYLTIDFTDRNAKTIGGEIAGAVATSEGVSSFTIEVTIAGATAPTLASWSMLSPPRPFGPVYSLIHHPVTFSAGGKFPITLPHGSEAGHQIRRVYFFNANMTSLEVKKNGLLVAEELDTGINDFIQQEYGRVPQTGLYPYDPVINNNFKNMLQTFNARTMQFNVTVSAADTVDVYAEYLANLAQL